MMHPVPKLMVSEFVLLLMLALFVGIMCQVGCHSAAAPFDLVETQVNLNLTSLNPKWKSQVSDNRLPDPSLCGGSKPYNSPCTTQSTWQDTAATCGDGHHNWGWATFDGTAFWSDHSCSVCDDDYNVTLVRPDLASYTQANPNGVLMEFDSDITIDHFDNPDDGWWKRFHNAVDDSNNSAKAMLDGKQVIALGVIGLDCEHSDACKSELHPVVALAVHVNDDLNDDHWAVFAMNWGDEGWCSSGYEVFPDVLPVSFLLPRDGATGVEILPSSYMYRRSEAGSQWGVDLRTGRGAELWFKLPSPGADPDDSGERYHGELHLRWTVPNAVSHPVNTLKAVPQTQQEKYDSVERVVADLIAGMTPEQRAKFDRLVPPTKPSIPDSVRVYPTYTNPDIPSIRPEMGAVSHVSSYVRDQRQRQIVGALESIYGVPISEKLRQR
jgi:hypothetical protein